MHYYLCCKENSIHLKSLRHWEHFQGMPFTFCRTLLLPSLSKSVTVLLRICFCRNTGVNSQQLCMSNLLWKLQKLRAVLISSVLPTASEGAALQHCPISSPCFLPWCLLDFTRETEVIRMYIYQKQGVSECDSYILLWRSTAKKAPQPKQVNTKIP